MTEQENNVLFKISHSDTLKFRKIVIDVMSEACRVSDDTDQSGGIGTLGEKQMHAAIKRFICPDTSCHEVKIDKNNTGIIDGTDVNNIKKVKARRFVADILKDNTIYEIQTGTFAPLKNKIQWILDNTDYNIILIHPIAETKWINLINSNNGEIERRYRSPVKGKISDIAPELYFIQDFLPSKRFSLVILIMEAEQYKKNTDKKFRGRTKYEKYELIPINLLRGYVFNKIDDYKIFIPDELDGEFTVKQYSLATKIKGMNAYSIVHTMCNLGLLAEHGKRGRATTFKRSF